MLQSLTKCQLQHKTVFHSHQFPGGSLQQLTTRKGFNIWCFFNLIPLLLLHGAFSKSLWQGKRLENCSIKSLSCVQLFAIPWDAARQSSLSITNSWGFLKLTSVELVMPSNHLILCRPLLLPPSIFLTIRVFSNESNEKKLVGSWQFHRVYPGHLCTYRLAR